MRLTDHGTRCEDPEFRDTVKHITETYPVTHVVETGTFDGLGSTRIFADFLPVLTIESNHDRVRQAAKNLGSREVIIFEGLSLSYRELRDGVNETLHYNYPEDVLCDGKHDTKRFYLSELNRSFNGKENLLPHCLSTEGFPIIFLDSCGGTGYTEFRFVMRNAVRPFIIMLDDCDHVKHYRSARELDDPHFFCDGRCVWEHVE